MIVRISTEGQYAIDEAFRQTLDELDREAVATCEAGDEQRFHAALARLLEFIRSNGTPVSGDELVGSDIILPPPDVSLKEAQAEFQGEGLIPG
ncbi:MAG: PspA-associated protein PspAA [Solirubrobacteraceae bacterium]